MSRNWREESGVTVLLALFVLTLTTLILGAVYQAVTNDTQGTRLNLDQNRAYAAAQAGIAQYTYQLNQNPNYWQGCPTSGTPGNPTKVAVPNSTDGGSTEYYTYFPLPAVGQSACSTSNPSGTMLEGASSPAPGTFRVESTGYSCTLSGGACSNPISRSIVAEFKQPSFLNYVYYTDYETLDPATLYDPSNNPPEPTDCAVHYNPNGNPNRPADCGGSIQFVGGDVINGPLHSEDWLAIGCPTGSQGPIFGRTGYNDPIETPGAYNDCGSGSPTYTVKNSSGAINTKAPTLTPPTSNSALLTTATANGYVYTGRTTIVLNPDGTTMNVTTATAQSNTGTAVPYPSNGVIYVQNAGTGCPITYTPFNASSDYPPADNGCGNVYVKGYYTKSLTIASGNDIIVNGNITTPTVGGTLGSAPTGSELLGLVANDFVRVYHPITDTNPGFNPPRGTPGCSNSTTAGGTLNNPYIYAAILAVNHSFIVDNYNCGAPPGTLTVYGAIAQLFRGTVGTGGNGSVSTGYLKDYVYDDRLAYSEPPSFLDPTSTAWYVARSTECDKSC